MSAYCDDSYDDVLAAVRKEMIGEPSEVQIGYRVNCLVRELDELCALANNPETRDLLTNEMHGISQIQFRASLILSFLTADKPRLTVVQNNG